VSFSYFLLRETLRQIYDKVKRRLLGSRLATPTLRSQMTSR